MAGNISIYLDSDSYYVIINHNLIMSIKENNKKVFVSFAHRSPLASSPSGKLLVRQFILSLIRCRGGIPPTTQI